MNKKKRNLLRLLVENIVYGTVTVIGFTECFFRSCAPTDNLFSFFVIFYKFQNGIESLVSFRLII